MNNLPDQQAAIEKAVQALKAGNVIAYPTEAVYGLGCDPFNEEATKKLFAMKKREPNKGLILVASSWAMIEPLIVPIEPLTRLRVEANWPGPITWVFPASHNAPTWITGSHKSIAIRMSAHPVVKALCEQFGKPIVSTSANVSGYPPIRDERTLAISFKEGISETVPGKLGAQTQPSKIFDAITGERLR
jgi:L-threonylcarbamoyladenylate synthase